MPMLHEHWNHCWLEICRTSDDTDQDHVLNISLASYNIATVTMTNNQGWLFGTSRNITGICFWDIDKHKPEMHQTLNRDHNDLAQASTRLWEQHTEDIYLFRQAGLQFPVTVCCNKPPAARINARMYPVLQHHDQKTRSWQYTLYFPSSADQQRQGHQSYRQQLIQSRVLNSTPLKIMTYMRDATLHNRFCTTRTAVSCAVLNQLPVFCIWSQQGIVESCKHSQACWLFSSIHAHGDTHTCIWDLIQQCCVGIYCPSKISFGPSPAHCAQ